MSVLVEVDRCSVESAFELIDDFRRDVHWSSGDGGHKDSENAKVSEHHFLSCLVRGSEYGCAWEVGEMSVEGKVVFVKCWDIPSIVQT